MHGTIALLLAAGGISLCGAAPHPSLPGAAVPEGLGVNIHFTDPRPGEMEMLAAAGFRWVRMDFTWSGTERERGRYDFSAYERLLTALRAQNVRAILILDYSNKLYEPERSIVTEEGRQAYARWAAAAVTRFQGQGILWEIWNEPNIAGFWKPAPQVERYTAMALAACKAMRAAAPGEAIIGPATSTIDLKFLEACFQAGLLEWWDAVSVHPYRQGGPETVEPELAKLRRLIARYAPAGKTIPVLSAEWGYSAAWKTYTEEKQGIMLPRELLINLSNEVPLSIWYDWHDDGRDPGEPEHHFGTVAFEYRQGRNPVYDPKPAYQAMKTLAETLAGFSFVKRLATGGLEDYVLLFAKGSELRLAVWTASAQPQTIAIPSSPCRFEVLSHTGTALPALTCEAGPLMVTARDRVHYLAAQGGNPALAATPEAHPLRVTVIPAAGQVLTARFDNLSDRPFQGRVRLVDHEGLQAAATELPLEFAAGEAEKTLRFPLASAPSGEYRAGLLVEREGQTLFRVPACRFAALPEPLFGGARVHSEGDPKVGSEQSLALAPAPEPLPDGARAAVQRLSYRLDSGWRYVVVKPQGSASEQGIAGEPKAFGLWIYGEGKTVSPRMRVIDATGQTWQPSAAAIDWTGWRFVTLDLKPTSGHWGGQNDGVIHYPLKWDALFLLDKVRDQKAEGTLHFTAPVAIY